MSVALTVSKTLGGAAVSDSLAGGGTGVDLGSVVNGEYVPIISQPANTGSQRIYVRHNATVDPITDVKTFIQQFSQTYGGAQTAAADFTTMSTKGAASGNSANNNDGLSSGLRIEHDIDLAGSLGASAFNGTRAQVNVYGRAAAGVSLATGFNLHVDALLYNNAGTPVDATAPVTGKIGKLANTVLGDVAFVKLRFYLEDAAPDGGIIMIDYIFSYSFTA